MANLTEFSLADAIAVLSRTPAMTGRQPSLFVRSYSLDPIQVLLVEDNEADIHLILEGLRDAQVIPEIHILTDGEQALKFLRHQPPFSEAPVPDLVLLDLNLPRLMDEKYWQR